MIGLINPENCSEETLIQAVKQNIGILNYMSESILTANICFAAVETHYMALQYIPESSITTQLCLHAVYI